jgi:hypothetical protein
VTLRLFLQPVDKVDQVGRPGGVKQLRSHGDLPRFLAAEPPHAHAAKR